MFQAFRLADARQIQPATTSTTDFVFLAFVICRSPRHRPLPAPRIPNDSGACLEVISCWPSMSAMGHKWPFRTILAQCLLSGVKQSLGSGVFDSPQLNVCFHQKRSFKTLEIEQIEGPLTAISSHRTITMLSRRNVLNQGLRRRILESCNRFG